MFTALPEPARIEIDYAALFGIRSIAAASIFAGLYAPLCVWFIWSAVKNSNGGSYVYGVLGFFCLIRLVAFIIRALLAGMPSLGENLALFTADEVLFGVGFFALLYSAYTLVLDREIISGTPQSSSLLSQLVRHRRLFRIALLLGVILGIIGIQDILNGSPKVGRNLREASTIIFLVLTVLQTCLALKLVLASDSKPEELELAGEAGLTADKTPSKPAVGDRYAMYLILLISLCLLVRQSFLTATLNNASEEGDERLWFPLVAAPEYLAVLCYSAPGLVPSKKAIEDASSAQRSTDNTFISV
ncbi:hypothetical protein FB45DRAFT_1052194 [Roridomyces roridus]|uniref:Uncharacterized protein n=1 Tax=Roridomyces roridus TaxID=1738132 RepID=A0AAD7CI53_9AGAR|nr:hypothetical protein FB45DRAFT_1052194 [Roridomyces roridus]